jgi:hypothetical protein
MDKKNLQQSRGGRSKNKDAMTAAAATSNKNIHQNEVFEQFEMLALRDERAVSAKSKTTMKRSDDVDVALRKKNKEETSSAAVDVSPSSKQQPKKSYRNSGGKKRGSKKNVLGVKPPAVVVEISEATVAPLNRKSSGGKNKKKNSNRKKESVAAAQDVENISANIHYGSYDGIYPEHYYHDLGYYYQDYYYQNFDGGYPVYEDEMAYHYQYGNMPTAMADQPPALNIDAPSFEPTGQHL